MQTTNKFLLFLKNNKIQLITSILFGIILTLTEIYIRSYYATTPIKHIYNPMLIGFLLSIILLYSRSKVVVWLYSIFIVFTYSMQYSNLAYFGYWASSMDIWLLFTKLNEVKQAGLSVLEHQQVAFIMQTIIFIFMGFVLYVRKYTKRKNNITSILGLIILFFYPIKMTIDQNISLGRLPQIKNSAIKTSLYNTSYFFSHTLPEEVFHTSSVPPYTHNKPAYINKPISDNIIVVMGESLSTEYMSSFGFEKKTTPWLDSQKSKPDVFLGTGFSAGLYTDVSVPFFFNLIERANARTQIFKGDSNLFKLAQEQGYKTQLYSAQMSSGLALVSMLGKQWLDKYEDSYAITKDINVATDDMQLVSWLKNAKLAKKNFIVLHQFGSHEPYRDRTPKNLKVFGQKTLYAEYLNSVYYTDKVLHKIKDTVADMPGTWTIVFTSDHGQHVTYTTAGKGRFKYPSNYLVPIYISSNTDNINKLTKTRFAKCPKVFHVQVAEFVSELMGYKNYHTSCKTGFITKSSLTGSSGYMKLERKPNSEQYKSEILFQ